MIFFLYKNAKSEPLRENIAGLCFQKFDDTNRLVYAADDKYLTIISGRYKYSTMKSNKTLLVP